MQGSGRKPKNPLLVALVGPTASGKSALAVKTAVRLGGEIVNCDSMQFVRGMEIGTAQPTVEQQRLVPHHLYGQVNPDEFYSAGRYMVEARRLCRQISNSGHIPMVVGGSGLYLRALLEGIFPGPGRSDSLRRRLHGLAARRDSGYLHRLLRQKDPETARRLHPTDQVRIVRALEVYFSCGLPISRLQARKEPLNEFSILKVGLNLSRPLLYDRINRRVEEIFRSGLLDEVQTLLDQGYQPGCKGFEAIGCRHALSCLAGKLTLREAIQLTSRDTRRYAKRQLIWFRKETEMHWIQEAGEDSAALKQLLELTASYGRRLQDAPFKDEASKY
ncbi:MAG: tRNA (adenosine(37)-N6)-dimethylallyltransferase MiaA [Acidobacteriota bacterium]